MSPDGAGSGVHDKGRLTGTELDDLEQRKGRRQVFRFTMLWPHACTGPKCKNEAHDSGAVDMLNALMMLGLLPTPGEGGHLDEWGDRRGASAKRRRAKQAGTATT